MKRSLLLVNSVLVFSALLMLWEAVILVFHVQPFMLPNPLTVAMTTVERMPDLFAAFVITAEEAAVGLEQITCCCGVESLCRTVFLKRKRR